MAAAVMHERPVGPCLLLMTHRERCLWKVTINSREPAGRRRHPRCFLAAHAPLSPLQFPSLCQNSPRLSHRTPGEQSGGQRHRQQRRLDSTQVHHDAPSTISFTSLLSILTLASSRSRSSRAAISAAATLSSFDNASCALAVSISFSPPPSPPSAFSSLCALASSPFRTTCSRRTFVIERRVPRILSRRLRDVEPPARHDPRKQPGAACGVEPQARNTRNHKLNTHILSHSLTHIHTMWTGEPSRLQLQLFVPRPLPPSHLPPPSRAGEGVPLRIHKNKKQNQRSLLT